MTLICSGVMVAPTTIASQYLSQAWRGAVILSFVWFLHRWKTNVFARALAGPSVVSLDREKLLALDKISSVGLFIIGIMALAEACGVAVQSILTVGGIGGQYQLLVVKAFSFFMLHDTGHLNVFLTDSIIPSFSLHFCLKLVVFNLEIILT